MDVKTAIKELSDKLGPPKHRAAHGQWVPFAWLVRGLVERGHGVTDAVKHVLNDTGFSEDPSAFGSVRAAYYKVKDQEWPAEFSSEAPKDEATVEGFE